jgi:hypothetical protein
VFPLQCYICVVLEYIIYWVKISLCNHTIRPFSLFHCICLLHAGKILSTESGAIGLEQSDEDDMEDEHTVPGDDETNDMINNKDDAFDEMEASWLVLLL